VCESAAATADRQRAAAGEMLPALISESRWGSRSLVPSERCADATAGKENSVAQSNPVEPNSVGGLEGSSAGQE
jgi:hypothetical protein